MSLLDLAHTSQYGPTNPNDVGTGTLLGPNTSPIENAQFGNPKVRGAIFNKLEDASHASAFGSFNSAGQAGTGIFVDPFGNIPSEVNFNSLP